MLVLTRRVNERLLIPCIQTSVRVLAARPTGVRLGIEAPPEVTVLREEVAPEPAAAGGPARPRQRLRNRLNSLSLGLALLRRVARSGRPEELLAALDTLDGEFAELRLQLTALIPDGPVGAGEPLAADSWHI